MEQRVVDVYTEAIQSELAAKFGVNRRDLESLGDFENFVYTFPFQGKKRILRISHNSHRSYAQLAAELDWVNYLAENGVKVARALPSAHGNLIEQVADGEERFFGVAFEMAPGSQVEPPEWNKELFVTLGQTIGKMHRLTKAYESSSGISPRFHWHEDRYMRDGISFVPASEPVVAQRWREVMSQMRALPTDAQSYGIIHTDVHRGNFHWHDNAIYLFDTDDCCRHWFMFDIVIVIYYATWGLTGESEQAQDEIIARLIYHVARGYERESKLQSEWWEYCDLFLRLRDLTLYAVLHLKWDTANLNERQRQMLAVFRERIIAGKTVTGLDFGALAKKI